MANPREIAMHILYDIEFCDAYSNMALKNAFLKHNNLKPVDKAFITNLVYGITSRKLTIEQYIKQNSKIKLKKISKYILLILQLGIYQIKFMDKVPESAAVNESVKLAKRYGHGASAGFVNGVLHSVIKNDLNLPDDKFEKLSCLYSYPVELCKKWCNDFGDDFAIELMKSMNEETKLSLRVNTLKTTSDDLAGKNQGFVISEIYKDAVISEGFDVAGSEIYKKGLIYPQDISAMLASVVLAPKKGDSVLDLCSAPGGKTTHMAQLMENDGKICACDVYEHKIDIINKNAERLGIDIIEAKLIDSTKYVKEFDSCFDKVLADVPCSGWGIIRRKPDIKWKNDDNNELISISKEILTNAAKYVRIDGEIVFSTCTINKDENENRLFEFLKENENFEAVDITDLLPDKLRKDTAKNGYVTFYPNTDSIDGFFIAKIKRCR